MATIRSLQRLSNIFALPVIIALAQTEYLESAQLATTQVMDGCHVLNVFLATFVLVV